MTKGEIRKARKAARANGEQLAGELALPGAAGEPMARVRTGRQERRHRGAMDRWARRYDDLNGAPEGDWDR